MKKWYERGSKELALSLYEGGGYTQQEIADIMEVSTTTVNRYFLKNNAKTPQHYRKLNIELIEGEFKNRNYILLSKEYLGAHNKLKYKCKNHLERGVLEITYAHFQQGRGCRYCAIENMANSKRTPYSKVVKDFKSRNYNMLSKSYTNSNELIAYECNNHLDKGTLYIRYSDLKRGVECPYCANEKLRGSYCVKLANENKTEWLSIGATLYIIKCYNNEEDFYKVGITKHSIKQRFNTRSKMPYDFKIIFSKNVNLYLATKLEDKILNNYSKYKYIPNMKFGGYSECLTQINLDYVNKICEGECKYDTI